MRKKKKKARRTFTRRLHGEVPRLTQPLAGEKKKRSLRVFIVLRGDLEVIFYAVFGAVSRCVFVFYIRCVSFSIGHLLCVLYVPVREV